MEVTLCCGSDKCPNVKVTEKGAEIGEGNEIAKLSKSEWNLLVEKIQNGELGAI